ncbi:NAD-dependent epimerase/dehydratase family protein [Pseudomonas syringae pv. tagetis]|uniref:NAD-dependent epimerase/dehydratase family protein n=2 Tax=Pseudomonas syringae pv. tagetis TaxID=129140 RepID=A0ABW7NUE9_9PSED|nr:NAD-dependent epimerase/dehydratase family protein [Pseudomonas syringae group genomosp. 7]UNB69517.1 NAD-dependent epimerase/dehydratase family protein [Pseudomonas syringae pv. tagetis]
MASGHSGMIFIIGSRGRLGQAIAGQYPSDQVVCVDRAVYERWAAPDSPAAIAEYFSAQAPESSVVYICSGLLDPRLPATQLHDVNFLLPRNIIAAVAPLGTHVVTFGTAMERTPVSNAYVQSKLMLSQFVENVVEGRKPTHIRIHTLYGAAEPSPFMFLGQILSALREGTPFDMTQGRQLREYHHVMDDAAAIRFLVDNHVEGVVELSHGKPVSLRDLAGAIFEAFGKSHLLRLGALPEPAQENFGHVFERPDVLEGMVFRDCLGSVVDYMKMQINA